jgi:hypothetical protein
MNHSSGHAKNDKDQHRLNLNSSTISDIRNSDTFKRIRLEMLAGKVPDACRECFREETRGIISKRLKSTQDYPLTPDFLATATKEDGSIDLPLNFLELRLGNRCHGPSGTN